MYNAIRIERERGVFKVRASDPAIAEANRKRDKSSDGSAECAPWKDPDVEYMFETKDQVIAFVDKAIDIALPIEEYSSAFDKFADEAKGKASE